MAKKRKNSRATKQDYKELEDQGPTTKGNGGTRSSARQKAQKKRGNKTADDYRLRESLEGGGEYTIIDMEADGNCLFRALSDQLYGDYGNQHDQVRSDVCDFIEDNKDDFSVFLVLQDDDCDEEDAADFESYIESMREDGEWGGNLELVAAARFYRRKITVYSAALAAFTIDHGSDVSAGPDLSISFHDNDHYNSVRSNSHPPRPVANVPSRRRGNDHVEKDDRQKSEVRSTTNLKNEQSQDKTDGSMKGKPKALKKGSPCPCGSGAKYKKCCGSKQRRSARTQRIDDDVEMTDNDQDRELEMKGSFRVLQI